MMNCNRHWHIYFEEGVTIYFGDQYGSPFITVGFAGFTGWTSRPKWMPGGWEFYSPWIGCGKLYIDRSRYRRGRILLPAKLVRSWKWLHPEYRRLMREEPIEMEDN